MDRPSKPRTTAKLPQSLNHQLNMYALAAGAAGVGLLALAQPAEARVVYTKTHRKIEQNSIFRFDLNHDGRADFLIRHWGGCSTTWCLSVLYVTGLHYGDGVAGSGVGRKFAYALKQGAQIGTNPAFTGTLMYYHHHQKGSLGSCLGSWVGVKNRYLGVKFSIKHTTHFGWARLSVACSSKSGVVGVLTGFAYETIPGKPIVAGETQGPDVTAVSPAGLGHLAAGASEIPAWRSRK